MNRIAIRFAAAAALGASVAACSPSFGKFGSAGPDFAQGICEAVVVGTGENMSVEHRGACPPGQTGYVSRVVGTGENLSVERTFVGTPTGHFGNPGIPMVEGTGENLSVVYVPQATPDTSAFAKAGVQRR